MPSILLAAFCLKDRAILGQAVPEGYLYARNV